MIQAMRQDRALALVLFTRRCATMLQSGVSLTRTLAVLEEDAPAPLAEAIRDARLRIEEGATMSQALAVHQSLFSPAYLGMVRAGEVGGILDVTMSRTADLLDEEWLFSRQIGWQADHPSIFFAHDQSPTGTWEEWTAEQRTLALLLVCRTWGTLLASGVPVVQALTVAADLLPAAQRDELLSAINTQLPQGTRVFIPALTFLPRMVRQLMQLGMETGTLDVVMNRVADLYRHELMMQK